MVNTRIKVTLILNKEDTKDIMVSEKDWSDFENDKINFYYDGRKTWLGSPRKVLRKV